MTTLEPIVVTQVTVIGPDGDMKTIPLKSEEPPAFVLPEVPDETV